MNMDERFNICLTCELQLWQKKMLEKSQYITYDKKILIHFMKLLLNIFKVFILIKRKTIKDLFMDRIQLP